MAGFLRFRQCHVQIKASDQLDSEAFLFKVGVELDGKLNPLTGMVLNLTEVDRILDLVLPPTGQILKVDKISTLISDFRVELTKRLPQNIEVVSITLDDWPHKFIGSTKNGIFVKWREDFVLSSKDDKKKFLLEVTQHLHSVAEVDGWIFSPRILWGNCVTALVKQLPMVKLDENSIYELLETTLDLNSEISAISARDLADRTLFEVRRTEG